MKTILYGAGSMGRSLLPRIKNDIASTDTEIYFADSNPNLWGSFVDGIKVMSPSEIALLSDLHSVIITTSQHVESVTDRLVNDCGVAFSKIDSSYVIHIYERTVQTRNRFLNRFAQLVYSRGIAGNCAEGGVYEGYFAKRINKAFPDRRLFLFDTFEGFDERDLTHENAYTSTRIGGLNINLNLNRMLEQMANPENIEIRKGYFPETTIGIDDEFVFVNLDFDLYAPTLAGLEFFYPKMVKGGVILVHDYFVDEVFKEIAFDKVRVAVDEFCAKQGVWAIPIGDEMSVAIVRN